MSAHHRPRRSGRLASHFRIADEDVGPPMCDRCQSEVSGQLMLPLVYRNDESRNFWTSLAAAAHAAVDQIQPARRASFSSIYKTEISAGF